MVENDSHKENRTDYRKIKFFFIIIQITSTGTPASHLPVEPLPVLGQYHPACHLVGKKRRDIYTPKFLFLLY